MCRVIGFFNIAENSNKSEIISKLAVNLSNSGLKTCLLDAYFGYNNSSFRFNLENAIDLKEFLIGRVGALDVVNKINQKLCIIRSDNFLFDYKNHYNDIKMLIQQLQENFDYVLIDINFFDDWICNNFLKIITECFIFLNNNIFSVRTARKLLLKVSYATNIKNVKLIIDNHKVIGELRQKELSILGIEKTLKTKVLYVFPKIKYCYKNKTNLQKNYHIEFCYNVITNENFYFNYTKKYNGFTGMIRRRLYEKFEI